MKNLDLNQKVYHLEQKQTKNLVKKRFFLTKILEVLFLILYKRCDSAAFYYFTVDINLLITILYF
jgi:hypothetical protein